MVVATHACMNSAAELHDRHCGSRVARDFGASVLFLRGHDVTAVVSHDSPQVRSVLQHIVGLFLFRGILLDDQSMDERRRQRMLQCDCRNEPGALRGDSGFF